MADIKIGLGYLWSKQLEMKLEMPKPYQRSQT